MIHGEEIGCPEPVFPVFVDGMKHTDESIFFHMDGHAIIRDLKIRDRSVLRIVRVHHPVLLDAGEPVPTKFRNTLQVIDTGIPTVEHDEVWLKSPG